MFFSQCAALHLCLTPFKVWAELERLKGTIVEEPESAKEFKAAKRHYEAAIDAQGGGGKALLLAVYRGKMSEVIF